MNNAFAFEKSPARAAATTAVTAGAGGVGAHPNRAAVVRHSQRPWRIPPSPQYLRALREADLAVRRAALRWVVLRHSSRLLEP